MYTVEVATELEAVHCLVALHVILDILSQSDESPTPNPPTGETDRLADIELEVAVV